MYHPPTHGNRKNAKPANAAVTAQSEAATAPPPAQQTMAHARPQKKRNNKRARQRVSIYVNIRETVEVAVVFVLYRYMSSPMLREDTRCQLNIKELNHPTRPILSSHRARTRSPG